MSADGRWRTSRSPGSQLANCRRPTPAVQPLLGRSSPRNAKPQICFLYPEQPIGAEGSKLEQAERHFPAKTVVDKAFMRQPLAVLRIVSQSVASKQSGIIVRAPWQHVMPGRAAVTQDPAVPAKVGSAWSEA
ncbi:hypothetical protein AURDEDRAFT_168527 [Auricularia subglabra TFB-10046 SS5]|nr:hypothetical protein AURDEDRAFT_168527 [Auricularia subglabra TFB-10046 SS5]